jgi:hypothetical protein
MTIALTILFLLLQAADVGSTRIILSQGGRERNPVARFFLRYGTAGLVALKVIVSAVFLYAISLVPELHRIACLAAACAIQAAVLVHNVRAFR